jgi:hypothetical protein
VRRPLIFVLLAFVAFPTSASPSAAAGEGLRFRRRFPPPPPPGAEGDRALEALQTAGLAIEVYRHEHGTYVGMTLAKLQQIDPGVQNISIRRATQQGYCIQSTVGSVTVHVDGPDGAVVSGPCA